MRNFAQGRVILAVDLDGALVFSDMLYETFWGACAKFWATPFVAISSLMQGRANLKSRLSVLANLDVTSLPYNDNVMAYIQDWRAEGGRTVLVTGCNQNLAMKVAAHLGVFDEAHGSDEKTNLKGRKKADFLEARFGDRGFVYLGHARADIPVWEKAAKAITVNPLSTVKARVNALGGEVEHLSGTPPSLGSYATALRLHQWLKNLLVFVPTLAAHKLNAETVGQSLLAFFAFSLVASSAYVINDLLDLASDRAHPRKRKRPFASGAVPITQGTWLSFPLLISGLILALPLGYKVSLILLAYYIVTALYSLHLKRRLVIDICMLAGLYTMRIVAGAAATGILLSVWLLAFSTFFFFALAAVKRQAELVHGVASGEVTAHGRGYHVTDLPLVANMAIASGYISVLVMALYVNSPTVIALYGHPYVLWGICLVLLYWISRMVMVAHRGSMHDDPLIYAAQDRVSQICLVLIICFSVGAGPL